MGKFIDLDAKPSINVREFLFAQVRPYDGDESFLSGPTPKTQALWQKCKNLLLAEMEAGGVLDIDTETISGVNAYRPGYIDQEQETIVGLQTDAPLKRGIKPFGGIRMVEKSCEEYGRTIDKQVLEIFTKYRKTHNEGVFSAYTEEMLKLRKTGILTGLPDAYARGRIIGDYRRVALYGIDYLIEQKAADKKRLDGEMNDEMIRLREEVTDQIATLKEMKEMAATYGFDISRPAENAQEAIQWTYFAYLSALKEQDGAAMSLGNVSNFFDVYLEKDLEEGKITEAEAQEMIDHFIMKLRLIRHL
nr:pyruvate formate lyase family protein [Candidatus Gracilibacteria bacterium]